MSTINQQTCKKCNICISVCPAKIFGKDIKDNTIILPDKEDICIECGQCMAVCETKSIQIDNMDYERDFFELPEKTITSDEFYNLLSTRRSVRTFKDKPVPKEILQKIIDFLALSPYGVSKDAVEITVVSERKILQDALPFLSEFFNKINNWMHQPFMRFMMKRKLPAEKFNTIEEHLMKFIEIGHYNTDNGKDNITRNAPAAIIFHSPKGAAEHTEDAMIYVTYAALAAHSLGLGATIIGLLPPAINKIKEIRDIFKIPNENEAIISLIVGYPKYHYKRGIIRERKKVSWL